MDKRKLVYHNKKVLEKIEKTNKEVVRKKVDRIADEEAVVLKDSLNYLGKRIPKNLEDADRKIDEVINYHKPKWISKDRIRGKTFFISSQKEEKPIKYDINSFYRKLFGIK